jgi:hypothetical protein
VESVCRELLRLSRVIYSERPGKSVSEYKVHKLLALRHLHKRWKFQVNWTGYQTLTLDPVETIRADVPEMFAMFMNRLPRRQCSQFEKSFS